MFQGLLENAMRRPSLRDTSGAREAGQAWTERRVDQAMDAAANPESGQTREQRVRRMWAGSDVSTGSGSYTEPGRLFGDPMRGQAPPDVDESQLRDAIMQRFGERADQEGGFFGMLSSDPARALSSRDLDPSVASLRSAMAARDSLAAAGTTLHPNRQGGAPVATNDNAMGLDTVQGQMKGLMSQDSNLMKQARTQGLQQANKRGLLNSSMAVGASQDAMARQALPIAQQDAGALQDLNRLQASSAANAWGVMANNVTDIVAQGMEGIANIQANPDITPEDKTKMIGQITDMRDTDIEFQTGLYQNLSSYLADTGLFPNL